MKILVTGRTGQLVTSLLERGARHPDLDLIAMGRPILDLTDPGSIHRAVADIAPDVIISAAAYTSVDLAETQPDLAHAVNVVGAAELARAADGIGASIIHMSTDYVFAGNKFFAYEEADPPAPLGVYGRTKLEGELAVRAATARHLIVRTSWVYSPFGRNFVRSMLKYAAEGRGRISVVADQWGNPTSALDLADAILHAATRLEQENYGLYHLAGTGATNWADLARYVFAAAHEAGGAFAEVEDIASAGYPTAAARPLNSRLSSHLFETTFDWRMPPWQPGVRATVRRIAQERPAVSAATVALQVLWQSKF